VGARLEERRGSAEPVAHHAWPAGDSTAADLWVMNADGSGQRNLTRDGWAATWAPAQKT
jgi:hypothetical protein